MLTSTMLMSPDSLVVSLLVSLVVSWLVSPALSILI